MKRLISVLLIIVLSLSVISCQKNDTPDTPATENNTESEQQNLLGVFPDSLTDADRQTLSDIAKSKKPIVTISKRPEEHSGCQFYYQAKAKELINLLASFKYTESICQCAADNVVYIGENLEFTFWLKKNPDGDYESVEHGGTSYQLTVEQSKKITQLVEPMFDEKNYKSIKGKENTVEFIERKGNSFVWYSFKNADADRLIYLVHNIKKTEPKIQGEAEYRFDGLFIRLALNCEKPFVSDRENSAYLTDEQIKEIKDILNRNCTSQNIKDDPDATMPVFIKDLKDKTKLYSFTNDASAFLINYRVFGGYEGQTENCNCNAQYTVYSHYYVYKQKNKEIVKDEYNISFVDGVVHITKNNSKTHSVLSKKDSEYIKEIIDKYCIEQNIVK